MTFGQFPISHRGFTPHGHHAYARRTQRIAPRPTIVRNLMEALSRRLDESKRFGAPLQKEKELEAIAFAAHSTYAESRYSPFLS